MKAADQAKVELVAELDAPDHRRRNRIKEDERLLHEALLEGRVFSKRDSMHLCEVGAVCHKQ